MDVPLVDGEPDWCGIQGVECPERMPECPQPVEAWRMDYLPPGRVVRVSGEPFVRYAIKDGLGQRWTGEGRRWSDDVSDAALFCRELDAVVVRNRHCLGGDVGDTFQATVSIVTHAALVAQRLARFLRRHRGVFIGGPAEKEGLLLEIIVDTVKRVKR